MSFRLGLVANLTYRPLSSAFDGEKSAAYHRQKKANETRRRGDGWIDGVHISRKRRGFFLSGEISGPDVNTETGKKE